MPGSTFQPPIHLDPNQDNSQQTAFINQNFQSLASALETNSFRIVVSGTVSVQASGNTNNTTTIPHNLGFTPIPFCFLSASNNTVFYPLPQWTSLTRDDVNHVINFATWIDCNVDSNNLNIEFFNSLNTTNGPFNVQYYLLQQSSS